MTQPISIISLQQTDQTWVTDFLIQHWGSTQMVISSGTFQCNELDGFSAVNEKGKIIGLITYHIVGNECEIISLDSIEENRGIGTALLQRVENKAKENGCQDEILLEKQL